jgi:hypothetical protein
MKVKIDCDKRLKERGGTEYEGGWYYENAGLKSDRYQSYSEAMRQARSAGHEVDNAGWKHKLLMWNWHSHAMDGYPGWEQATVEYDRPCPAFAKLTHKMGKGDPESSKLCNAWDDVAAVGFYQRDWTDDGIPFVNKDEVYWSGWWFETIAERDRFLAWYEKRKK